MVEYIYKIFTKDQWTALLVNGVFEGAPADLADGFIHFSTASQVAATARKHFSGAEGLVLAAVSLGNFTEQALRWEPARDGDLFPHLYGVMDAKLVIQNWQLSLDGNGQHVFPADAGIIEVS